MSKATPESVQAVFSPDSILDEVAHLNSLLTDSYATTSALFQLLHDHNIHVGSPELIKAREKVEVEMQTLRTANAGLVEKVNELEAARTKAAANSLANMLSCEELEEKVKRLMEALDTLEVRGDQMNDELYPPDSNCSCHISPPCNDCTDWASIRLSKRDWEEAKQKAAKAKGRP